MIVLIGAVLGALIGALTAWRRKGTTADILQYAVIYAMILAVCGLFVTLVILRASV